MVSKQGFGKQVTTNRTPLTRVPTPPSSEPSGTKVPDGASSRAAPTKVNRRSLSDFVAGSLSKDQVSSLNQWGKRSKKGPVSQAKMVCKALECEYVDKCPLKVNNVPLPMGDDCPVEDFLVESWIEDFKEKYDIDDEHPDIAVVDSILGELAFYQLIKGRIAWNISMDPRTITEEVLGVNNRGEAIKTRKVNPDLEFFDKISPKMLRFLKELIATPRSKVEAGKMGWKDPSTRAAEAIQRASKMKELRERSSGPIQFNQLRFGEGSTVRSSDEGKQPDQDAGADPGGDGSVLGDA